MEKSAAAEKGKRRRGGGEEEEEGRRRGGMEEARTMWIHLSSEVLFMAPPACEQRQQRIASKALRYARTLVLLRLSNGCSRGEETR